MAGYDDPNHEGNSPKYHTGKFCIEGCGRPAGTAWSPYWCFECNVKRINRINVELKQITSTFTVPVTTSTTTTTTTTQPATTTTTTAIIAAPDIPEALKK